MVIRHEDADDLVQEVFIRIFRNLSKFRQESELFTWIYRITINEVISFLNRQKRKKLLSLEPYESVLASSLQNDPYFTGDEIQQKLQKALLKLPAKQRLVFQMKYYDEITYEKMSEILGTSVGALKASYHHAVRKIEQIVLDH
jgi:RNA polymerase sigma-70 factor (ECF subfamily)